ncbi:MAG: DUF3159 domain-containing protein [Streptosporangiales bacterium]|nr:DUF3159 domain-containing protein [Streptosporangiales bacterium]
MTESQAPAAIGRQTVEAVIRGQLSKALGGRRGIVESAVPTIVFTVSYVLLRRPDALAVLTELARRYDIGTSSIALKAALAAGIGSALVLLLVRVLQRSTVQFTINSLIGIAIAAVFAMRTGRAADAFVPGMLYNAAYAAGLMFSIFVRWPFIGLMIGAVTGDLSRWREDPAVVRLCSLLTWMLVIPCLLRVAVQYPIYLADQVTLLATAKLALGWPLQVAGLAAMVWLLSRNHTPLADGSSLAEAQLPEGAGPPPR